MLDPEELFTIEAGAGPDAWAGSRPVLVHNLAGFIDAGAAARLAGEHLLGALDHELIARFEVDQLLDYRSRRPVMIFEEDHWAGYATPGLELHAVRDNAGTPFLLLTGIEPDLQWERFAAAVQLLIERFNVGLTVGLNAIPMAVPHTRPIGVTAHATRTALVAGHLPWVGTVSVPASAAALLELRLGQNGHDAMGFAVHVPHYLTQAEYPDAAEALLEAVVKATGLSLPTAALRSAAERTRQEIDEQIGRSEEVAAVVRALEQQYDAFASSRERGTLLAAQRDALPTADELGAELERFLAEHDGRNPGH
jgi:predicted ATP-grasp superfamily ATP-dependent carboligase